MTASGLERVTANEVAMTAVERLQARNRPLTFVQSGGCRDGSSPIHCVAIRTSRGS